MKGNEPAFSHGTFGSTGLTKREWFAGMALSGMDIGKFSPEASAQVARLFADYLIEELGKK